MRYLQTLSSSLDVAPDKDLNSTHYLCHINKNLTEREKIVSLLCDEIYIITPRLDYRNKKIVGTASNDSSWKDCFDLYDFILFGSLTEVVKILPVHKLKGNDLASNNAGYIIYSKLWIYCSFSYNR